MSWLLSLLLQSLYHIDGEVKERRRNGEGTGEGTETEKRRNWDLPDLRLFLVRRGLACGDRRVLMGLGEEWSCVVLSCFAMVVAYWLMLLLLLLGPLLGCFGQAVKRTAGLHGAWAVWRAVAGPGRR